MAPTFVLATQNTHKLGEIRAILAETGWLLLGQDDVVPGLAVEETGTTFAENAALKAEAVMHATGLPTLADDSGLVVEVLDGAPGVHSARYAAQGNHRANLDLLLRNLRVRTGGDFTDVKARFVCVVALAEPGKAVQYFEGSCEGRIIATPAGTGGFGYDPVFVPSGENRTLAELGDSRKNELSHRGKAFREVVRALFGRT